MTRIIKESLYRNISKEVKVANTEHSLHHNIIHFGSTTLLRRVDDERIPQGVMESFGLLLAQTRTQRQLVDRRFSYVSQRPESAD